MSPRANKVPASEANLAEADIVSASPVSSLSAFKIEPAVVNLRDKILSKSGARPFDRDPIDARLLQEISAGGGALIDKPRAEEVAYLEKMAVSSTRKAFPDIADPAGDANKNGWTNLEEFIFKTYK